MHSYTLDGHEHRNWTIGLFLISLLLSWLVNYQVLANYLDIQLPWFAETPTTLVIFGFLYSGFNNYAWRWKFLHKLQLVTTPDLNGSWRGNVCSSHDKFESETAITLKIVQSWNQIRIELNSDSSQSRSEVAAITSESPYDHHLHYNYTNEPNSSSQRSMEIHRGTVRLKISGNELIGDYYTGRGRTTFGEMKLRRTS